MPVYEYRCQQCAHQYEKREGFDAPSLQSCPTCGGSARRVLHAPPIVFKGSGFYATDSRRHADDGSKAEPTPAAPSTEKPSSSDSDSSTSKDAAAAAG